VAAMRIVRSILAALLTLSLVVVPVAASASVATHATKAEMSMSAPGDDCPCCNADHKCPSDICAFKCATGPALFVARVVTQQPLRPRLVPTRSARLSPFAPHPELP